MNSLWININSALLNLVRNVSLRKFRYFLHRIRNISWWELKAFLNIKGMHGENIWKNFLFKKEPSFPLNYDKLTLQSFSFSCLLLFRALLLFKIIFLYRSTIHILDLYLDHKPGRGITGRDTLDVFLSKCVWFILLYLENIIKGVLLSLIGCFFHNYTKIMSVVILFCRSIQNTIHYWRKYIQQTDKRTLGRYLLVALFV